MQNLPLAPEAVCVWPGAVTGATATCAQVTHTACMRPQPGTKGIQKPPFGARTQHSQKRFHGGSAL